jgi:tetratricopeptide (TPR) repeat protein
MSPKPSRVKQDLDRRKARRLSPTAAAIFADAVRRHQDGRPREAEPLYRQVLVTHPRHADSLHLLGLIAYRVGRNDLAIALINQAIEADPGAGPYRSSLGAALAAEGRLDEALAAHQAAVALKPGDADSQNNLGAAWLAAGRLDEAAACFQRAVALRPDLAEALGNLGDALRLLGRPSEAADACRRAIALRPDQALAHNTLGAALADLGRLDEAAACYQTALSLSPTLAAASNNLAITLRALGRLEDAVALGRETVAREPGLAEAHYNLAAALADLDQPEEALASYDRALALKPDLAPAYDNKALLLTERGRFDAAAETIEAAIRVAPRRVRAYYNLTQIRRIKPDDPHLRAMEDLAQDRESLSVEDRIDLNFALGKALMDSGDPARAFERLSRANALKRATIAYDEAAALGELEHLEALFTPEPMGLDLEPAATSDAPVFIVGMPRSGTTLVEQILASHPRVFAAGETAALAAVLTELGAPRSASPAAAEQLWSISATRSPAIAARYRGRLRAMAPNAARITNKTPDHFRHVGLILRAMPGARIIHVRRDPVDTCLSCFSTHFTGDLPYAYDLAELGRYHRACERLMDHWGAAFPGSILDVHYERIVADLEGQARRLIDHCGLGWDPACLDFHRTERPVRTASAVQVRQPLYAGAVGRWRPFEPYLRPLIAALKPRPAIERTRE